MHIKLHTAMAIFVLLAAGAWVASGKYAFVGSEIAAKETGEPAPKPASDSTKAPSEALQTVAYVIAKPAPYERRIRLSGQTVADKQVTLVARTSGAISKLAVSQGDMLANDGLVMALEGPEKLAAVVSAQSQFDTAVHQTESSQRLFARGALPELQMQASVSAREAARSALEMARSEADRLEVHAPFAGVIDKVFVEVGSWVQPGTEIATLLALDPIVVVGEINERDLQSVSKGTAARVTFGDGALAEGSVRYVRREATGLTRTFPIEVAIANADAAFSSGMSAEIELATKTAPAVVMPRSVITLDSDGTLGVRVLNASDMVGFQKVDIVDDTPQGLVLTGIEDGAKIIVSGQNMVNEGQKVSAVVSEDLSAAASGTN
jgi:membrane fusion protein, multidrug efflux system